jgi:hypothetical protein
VRAVALCTPNQGLLCAHNPEVLRDNRADSTAIGGATKDLKAVGGIRIPRIPQLAERQIGAWLQYPNSRTPAQVVTFASPPLRESN